MFEDDVVDDAVFPGLLRVHDEVALHVFFYFVQLLPTVLREQLVRNVTHPQDFPRMNVNIGRLAAQSSAEPHIFLTGGDARLLEPAIAARADLWPEMTLEGLSLSAEAQP